jgi:hypothetical protein
MGVKRGLLFCLLLMILFLGLVGCQGGVEKLAEEKAELVKGEELEFETIELTDAPSTPYMYKGQEPNVFVITKTDNIKELEEIISRSSLEELNNIDFDTHFVLAIFRGVTPSDLYYIEVKRIDLREGTMIIDVDLSEGPLDVERSGIAETPYHIIKLSKDQLFGEYTIELVGEETILTMKAYIP